MNTTRVVNDSKHPKLLRQKVKLEVVKGPDKGKQTILGAEEINIGSLQSNDLVLSDTAVSRYHLRVSAGTRGFVITDLDSTNGSFVGPLRLGEVTVTSRTEVRLGDTLIYVIPLSEEVEVPLHNEECFGRLVGRSTQMRALFAKLPSVASSQSTVMIEGETGTGKEVLAEEIHHNSTRRDQAFVVADCGSIPEHLMESELFGHLRGSFTNATTDRVGAFELASGGTLFLDEVGELSTAAQPRLLRALESRQVKPVGASRYRDVDVRIIAATNRDLRLCVNEGTFRSDLFYRLSVVRLRLPPLRERPEDIEPLAKSFIKELWNRRAISPHPPTLNHETIQRLVQHRWPGNIRELRNFMERVVVLANSSSDALLDLESDPLQPQVSDNEVELDLPYKDAKMQWIDQFERTYVSELLRRNNNNVAGAARQAGVDRTYLFRLIRKYDLRK